MLTAGRKADIWLYSAQATSLAVTMTDLNLSNLKKRSLSVLRIGTDDWYDFEASRGGGVRFTIVVPYEVARQATSRTPVLIVLPAGGLDPDRYFFEDERARAPQLKLGWISSIQKVATRQSRLAFDHITNLEPATLTELVGSEFPARFRSSAADLATSVFELETLTPKFGEWLFDRIASFPGNTDVLRRLTAIVGRPRFFRSALALQYDALALALRAFGAPAAAAEGLNLGPRSTALEGVRAQENLVIEHDARWIPGWTLADSDVTGRALFREGRDELEVFTANREDLERVFGVDLIYLNQRRRSLVMVQYKMLEPQPPTRRQVDNGFFGTSAVTDEQEWTVPINEQFKKELARMEAFDSRAGAGGGSYRMNSSPFYFKLVKRTGSTSGAGIMLSLGHLKQLAGAGALTGPRDGLRIAYSELAGHYLRSESFVELIRSGYIGSHDATTDHLQAMIEATLSEGRSVVAAIQRAIPSERAPGSRWR
jgi:hypothetical protein